MTRASARWRQQLPTDCRALHISQLYSEETPNKLIKRIVSADGGVAGEIFVPGQYLRSSAKQDGTGNCCLSSGDDRRISSNIFSTEEFLGLPGFQHFQH